MSDQRPVVDVAYGDATGQGLPVQIGVPFRQGEFADAAPLAVVGPDGESQMGAYRPLAKHADGSLRWAAVAFGAKSAGQYTIQPGVSAAGPSSPVNVTEAEGLITLATGDLSLELAADGPGPIRKCALAGRSLWSDPRDFALAVDEASTANETTRELSVLHANPWTARVRASGTMPTATGDTRLNYRLDVEVWAGWNVARLDFQFFNLNAGHAKTAVNRIAMDVKLDLGDTPQHHFLQKNHGLFYVPRQVTHSEPVAIVADDERAPAYVEDPAMLHDDIDYPFYLEPPLVATADWLGVRGDGVAAYAQMEHFTDMRPSRLAVSGDELSAEVWPERSGTLELPQGRSRRQSVALAFFDESDAALNEAADRVDANATNAAKGAGRALSSLWHESRAAVDPAWLRHCGEFGAEHLLPVGEHLRFENYFRGLMNLQMPETKFDFGDTIDSGYSSTYSSSGGEKKIPRLPGAPKLPRSGPRGRPTQTYIDMHEPVWTNNEYDIIHAFAAEVWRTGRQDLLPTLTAAVRHNIEVDFLHYSDHRWLHRATPAHSADHTNTGAYPSHFWTQGLLEYYCMTGDIDALEVAVALGDKVIENFSDPELRDVHIGFNREIGWSILSLAALMDVTGEARFEKLATELVDYLLAFDRYGYAGAVNLSAGNDRQSLHRQIVGNFFGYATMIEGVDCYAAVTGREDVDAWLKQFTHDIADAAEEAAREGALNATMFGLGMSIGYERTGDERMLKLALLWLDQLFWLESGRTTGEVKPTATTHRGTARVLGHLQRKGWLTRFEFPSRRPGFDPAGESHE